MTIEEIYELAIKEGFEADPRGKNKIKQDLTGLKIPYSDTRVLFGNLKQEVKRVLVGIDISPAEVLLAERIAQKGKKIDLIIGHHPFGTAFPDSREIIGIQVAILKEYGILPKIAKPLLKERIEEAKESVYSLNRFQSVDTAKFLNISCMCIHTPSDNLAFHFLINLFKRNEPKAVGDVVKILNKIPEYQKTSKENYGPMIIVGNEKNYCGRIILWGMTGGIVGPKNIYKVLARAGVRTVVSMYQSAKHRKEAEKSHLNVVVAGHMASDSLGMNLFLDQLEKRGIEVLTCSGLIRVIRS